MRRVVGWALLLLAGAAFYVALNSWWKGLLLVVGTVLISVGVDKLTLTWEKSHGEID